MGSASAVFLGVKNQAVPFLWDQGPTFVTLLESGIRNLGTKMGSAMKNPPPHDPVICSGNLKS